MTDQYSFKNIDHLLFQYALQTRELHEEKNELNQQIKVYRDEISEMRSFIKTIQKNIEKLEEEITVKQNTVIKNKESAKSLKAANILLLQYEQTLKEELESRKTNYNQDMEAYEERIASYSKTFQSHKDYYCQNPVAQQLLKLQAEKEEIESRIKAYDDQIILKQKELEHLTSPAVNASSPEKLLDSDSGHQLTTEGEKQFDGQKDEDTESSLDISSLHLNQTKDDQAGHELWSCQQLDEQRLADVMHTEGQGQETGTADQAYEQQPTVSDTEEAVEEEMEQMPKVEEQVASEGNKGGFTPFPSPSKETYQSSPAKVINVPSTPTFQFNLSPGGSPHQGPSGTKSPASLFSLNTDPSTPGFSGFGFDMGSSQDEDSAFTFAGPFFNEKKTTKSKSTSGPEFLFGQTEQSEGFQFAFASPSPEATNKDSTRDEFPFSFNF